MFSGMAEARRRRREYWAAFGGVATAVLLAAFRLWPVPDAVRGRSWFEVLLGDPVLVGVLRLAVFVAALYFVASVPALVMGGRWVSGLGTGGITTDAARADLTAALELARHEVATVLSLNDQLTKEKAELWDLLDVETRPNRMGT